MCDDCAERIETASESVAAVKTEWTCPKCGPSKFEKDADPERLSSIWDVNADAVVFVCLFAWGAAAVIAVAVWGK